MMKSRRFEMGDTAGDGSDSGRPAPAFVLIDEEDYCEIAVRLANTILELAKEGFDPDECERRVVETVVEALEKMENAGTQQVNQTNFDDWLLFPFSRN